ncbi:MAG: hypothetical protein KC420_01190 [Myxococcales bacterium]|nr:hypothetical protein [Myxococcales bacterium]
MERRSPLRIAVEGLTEGRMAAARGALEEALDAHDLRSNPARSGANLRR